MKANELRIGNILEDGIVESIIYQQKETYLITLKGLPDLNLLDMTPVELTEEGLVRLGFEKDDFYNNWTIKVGSYYYHSIQFQNGTWVYSNDKSNASCYIIAELKYVHQLQNLYFALTGEELIMKAV